MRGTPSGFGTAYPLAALLPAVFQEDDLLMRFTAAIDELLAPAISSLDCLAAYVDPALAPPDYLGWLAAWVGIELDETWPVERQREAVAQAVGLHRHRGTLAGLRDQVELASGGEVEISESGGVTWSLEPTGRQTVEAPAEITVTVRGSSLSRTTLEAIVDAAKPAHVVHEVRLITDVR
jgi:phage tail-like protein